uniref:Carboxypeptidase n=1 Tax=Oryza punctata TaxID=4537 RepID=A0A0E0KEH1_ORYPU
MSKEAFALRLFFLLFVHGAFADQAARVLEFSRSRMEMRDDQDTMEHASQRANHQLYMSSQDGFKEADKVSELPGQPGRAGFDQYAGYVTVNATSGKALFYYFAEAVDNPSTKPLVLWLNGGPGCSSLGDGAMLEIGPFFVNSDNRTLSINRYAWNNVANMLFLESPAGVGFSYSNTTSDYDNTGDTSTAADAYTFLTNWLERFPEYKGRDFFITGESYGGHYIPQLANAILSNNNITNATIINLKGVAIGNAYLDDSTNTRATIDYYWTHALISKETHLAVQRNCSFNGTYMAQCRNALAAAETEKGVIDPYNIYAPLCWNASDPRQLHGSAINVDPCSRYYIESYLNHPEVQRTLHANTTGLKQPWSDCRCTIVYVTIYPRIDFKWSKHMAVQVSSNIFLKLYLNSVCFEFIILLRNVNFYLSSGDIDAVCPVTSTLYSLDILELPINSSWRPWYSDDNEVAGYVVGYKGLVFATVRESGHMVPTYQPQRALTFESVANTAARNKANHPLEFDQLKIPSKYGSEKQDDLREKDRVRAMPGQMEEAEFNQYAGYVTVDAKAGRALFYYFVEAPPDPLKKPLVLWLNGGPGCSSFGAGAMLELGPFSVRSDNKTLYKKQHAWNTVANMLFVDVPAGVGYSYSNTTSDYYNIGDKRTTDDAYTFLINWMKKFPEYQDRDFFITGESYAGHYIPELANLIVSNNRAINSTNIKLKGVAIGNADLHDNVTLRASFDYYWRHAMISDRVYKAIQASCGFNETYTKDCQNAMNLAIKEKGNVDDYNIYAPQCHDASNPSGSSDLVTFGDPCTNHYVSSYLNNPEVQRALHANTTGLNYPWMDCSQLIFDSWKDSPETMLPSIKTLISSGTRIWLYSGDMDAVCSVTSTQYALDILGLPVETSWRPWRINNEVAGYVVGYRGLVFATVRGAGHMVPYYQPRRALALLSSFLEGKLPPE